MHIYFKRLGFFVIFSLSLFLPKPSLSQEIVGNVPLAIEYFNEKNYDKALPIFTQLINKFPNHAMYNYYYGVCLLKNDSYETATKESLLNAAVDKTPANVNFYLGNYFHALGNWAEALDFYDRYKGNKQERRELGFDKYYDLCLKHINPFNIKKTAEKTFNADTFKLPASMPDSKIFPIPDSLKTEWFNFPVNSQLTYHSITDFRSEAAKILFTKAWLATGKNDSIVKNTDILRKAHEDTHDVTTRIALVQRIIDAEQLSYQYLHEREKYFEQARVKESAYWEKLGAQAMANFIVLISEREKTRAERLLKETKKTETVPVEMPDTAFVANIPETVKQPEQHAEQQSEKLPEAEYLQSPVENNIVFRVQIGSFPNGKMPPAFKTRFAKMSKFRKIDQYTDSKKYVIYTIGNFTSYEDASLLKNQLIMEGAKGAFLAAFKDGERVPVTSVVKEKPSAKKPTDNNPLDKKPLDKKPVAKKQAAKKVLKKS